MALAGPLGPGSAARARHCSGRRREPPEASVLWGNRSSEGQTQANSGLMETRAFSHKTGGGRPCCGGDTGWMPHLAPIDPQVKLQACTWVQMKCRGYPTPPLGLHSNEVPAGSQMGKGPISLLHPLLSHSNRYHQEQYSLKHQA